MPRLSLQPLLSLFLTTTCPFCERAGQPLLCQDCQQQLKDCQSPQRSVIQHQSYGERLPLTRWGRYEGQLKRAIAQLKYHNTPALAHSLGAGLAEAWLQSQPINSQSTKIIRGQVSQGKKPWVIPVPMHPDKQRQRGFNQAELIARSFCRHTGLPLLAQGLQRTQATQAQFELSPAERQRNVAQAFALGPALQKQRHHRPVLLLDDIYTTGATVGAIAQILSTAQIPIAGIAVVAQAIEKGTSMGK